MRLHLTGAELVDVAVDGIGAVECLARESRWRNVVVDGGRIGTLDALRAEWNGVTLRGLRIDYIGLASADLSDALIAAQAEFHAATLARALGIDARE